MRKTHQNLSTNSFKEPIFRTPCSNRLIEMRNLFLSKRAFESHVMYALAQIKRSRGQNKLINNPKPESPPVREDFCWVIARDTLDDKKHDSPYRPIPLHDSNIDLSRYHVSALEHCHGVFRLYHYGEKARGVFREGNLICESIPRDDEVERCAGLLIFNQFAYEKAMRDHQHYWNWMRNRNETRWRDQESGSIDYDAKNLMHTFRLILSAEHIFQEGLPLVRFEGNSLQFLLSIRAGNHAYDDLVRRAEEKVEKLIEMRSHSSLPDAPDNQAITNLLQEITAMWEMDHA